MQPIRALIAAVASLLVAGAASAKPPPEAFGFEPAIRGAHLSPDGSKVVYIQTINGQDTVAMYDFAAKKAQPLARIPDGHARYVTFVGNDRILAMTGVITSSYGYGGRYQASAAYSYNLATRKFVQLLIGTPRMIAAQTGLGIIVGLDTDGRHVFMPAYMERTDDKPARDLLRVDLDTGKGETYSGKLGNENTEDWLVSASGQVLAREDFDDVRNIHEITVYDGGKTQRKIYTNKTPLPTLSLAGVSKATGALLTLERRDSEFESLYERALADGAATGPVATRADAEVDGVVTDLNRVAYGVRFSGLQPSYEMFDKAVDADIKELGRLMPDSTVEIASWTDDWSKILILVEGGALPERYMLFDRKAKSLTTIVNARPEITQADVGEVIAIRFKARDGLEIPTLVTWPAGVPADQRKNLPMVMMPHGGPEAYDSVRFDWLAQFVANQGYMVVQPNFRGSAGFGARFIVAGHKEWGRKMQDDITDAVKAVTRAGWADPNRVCIVGWSYGGYAALAGGALTPDLYKCVVAIAGVSDLREMLSYERNRHGSNSSALTYWSKVIGDPDDDKEAIDSVSPARHADAYTAPVLLIHGSDDTTVPSFQSDRMNNALRGKGKYVNYVKINGDDHQLSNNESRRQVLTALADFLATYLRTN